VAAKINPKLLERLQSKLHVGPQRVYVLIQQKVLQTSLPRHIAALAVAAEHGVNILKYASQEDLVELRSGRSPTTESPAPAASASRAAARGSRSKRPPVIKNKKPGKSVFVVHGRDLAIRDAMFHFLRAIGLSPMEWPKLATSTKKGTPYTGEVLDVAFQRADAVVVLLTPDDEARLKAQFRSAGDEEHEARLTGQARANVLFEAGMAFGRHPDRTVLVEVGNLRRFSDVAGRNVIRLSNTTEKRQELAMRLKAAHCGIDLEGTAWMTAGDFTITLPLRS
jgi:predicted nucleotide-binding protein